ncbi:transposase domain-containing protein [Gemmobacter serpentinus]|uniref:transposase domain-containing protein n=1 Tax=Gemmobacter serpentinus TaxID=2652247 RepID=UPI001CF61B4F|nr:transposase domain-containing protein [Gemmobacter serpentinus]
MRNRARAVSCKCAEGKHRKRNNPRPQTRRGSQNTSSLGLESPLAYLKATLEALADGHPQIRLDELLPWSFSPSS